MRRHGPKNIARRAAPPRLRVSVLKAFRPHSNAYSYRLAKTLFPEPEKKFFLPFSREVVEWRALSGRAQLTRAARPLREKRPFGQVISRQD